MNQHTEETEAAEMSIYDAILEEGRVGALRSLLIFKFQLKALEERYESRLKGATPEIIDRYLQRVLVADSLGSRASRSAPR